MIIKLLLVTAIAFVLTARVEDAGFIMTMYSSKETRGLGGYFEVHVDGKKVAKLRFPTYFRLAVPPGAYTVTMDDANGSPVLCHVIAGETCYVRARLVGKENRREFSLVSPEEAGRQLRDTFALEREKIYVEVWK